MKHNYLVTLVVGARFLALAAIVLSIWLLGTSTYAEAQSPETKTVDVAKSGKADAPADDKANLKRLSKDADVWIDAKKKQVILEGEVSLTKGQLEMFACPIDTKEHESVVRVKTKAQYVHAALLALGAKVGGTVKFEPKYVAASGTKVDILVRWTDEQGKKHEVPAQQWIKNAKTGKAMEYSWVFAGSGFWVDENTGLRHYLADAGDFICVSNFSSAMLDLPVASPMDNDDLLYEAFTENIPPRGTKVTLILMPQLDKAGEKKDATKKDTTEKAKPAK